MKNGWTRHLSVYILFLFCIGLGIFLGIRTKSFLTLKNLINILEASSYRMILAIGMTFVIAAGLIDLSVGSTLSLTAILMALGCHNGWPVPAAVLAGLLLGGLLGSINGLIIQLTKVNALIITLATSFLYRGLALIITRGTPVTKLPQTFRSFGCGKFLGMESGVTMALFLLLLSFPLMYRMRWGHYITALGGNAEALLRSGVRTWIYRIGVFAAMGMLAALAGVIVTARLNSAEPNAGLDMEMDAVTAVIMGGTPLSGGQAELLGTAAAVFLLSLIRNGLTLLSVSSYYQQFITGGILLIAVIIAELRQRKERRM